MLASDSEGQELGQGTNGADFSLLWDLSWVDLKWPRDV